MSLKDHSLSRSIQNTALVLVQPAHLLAICTFLNVLNTGTYVMYTMLNASNVPLWQTADFQHCSGYQNAVQQTSIESIAVQPAIHVLDKFSLKICSENESVTP